MKRLMIVTASAAALASASAFAQTTDETSATPQYTPEAMTVAAVAPNALKVTTKEEAKAFAKAEFAMIDADGDAKIQKAEYLAAAKSAHAKAETALNETLGAADETVDTAQNTIDGVLNAPASVTAEASVDAEGQVAEGDTDVETAEQQFIGLAKDQETISEQQLIEARIADFKEADANADGKLDADEKARFAEIVKFGAVF